jgi:hypothetical protein
VSAAFSFGTGAQFALLPPENAPGNFVKVVDFGFELIEHSINDPANGEDAELSDDQLPYLKAYASVVSTDNLIDHGLLVFNHPVPNCTVPKTVLSLFAERPPAVARLVPDDPRPK